MSMVLQNVLHTTSQLGEATFLVRIRLILPLMAQTFR